MRRIWFAGVAIGVLLGALGFLVVELGLMPTRANSVPPALERSIATRALNASMIRHAPRLENPYPTNDQNLIEGMKIYTMNCSVCHGTLDNRASPLEHSFYPPVPQLILEPLHDPAWRTFYVVRTGVRYTAMPAWEGVLSEQDMWRVTDFISRVRNLPPGAASYLRNLYAPAE